ncbi:MAG: DegT/DnrJ/EryC1/StrS family aminotransferase [Candidatus Omnitrophica bacterium]|nr:DegT/DnrJ/EryC1/StrS family aminotransferase [Candidatus Omnitrophota bacterium]
MVKIPMLDLKRQIIPIRQELDAAIKRVIDNTNFILGDEVRDFESEVQKYCNAQYAVGVSNGTDAIKLALLALGIKPADKVVCPAFTYYATAGAIAAMGAIPVFADIDLPTYNISAESIEEAVKKHPRGKIKAVIPVHLYGQCADMDGIMDAARKHKLKVIEDAAQAFGAEYKGKKAGTIGDCGSVSFFPGKNLGAFGDAGMVITNDKTTAEKLKILRNQGNKDKYYHLVLGHNNRMDTIQAAVLMVKLKYLESWNEMRRRNAAYFNEQLKGAGIKTPFVPGYTTHIYHQYVLRLDGPSDGLVAHLRAKGIDARVFYPVPLHLQECFKHLNYKKGDFPESEKASVQTLAIPVYPDLTREELDFIINSIKEFLK